jgi:hypothetical protein
MFWEVVKTLNKFLCIFINLLVIADVFLKKDCPKSRWLSGSLLRGEITQIY